MIDPHIHTLTFRVCRAGMVFELRMLVTLQILLFVALITGTIIQEEINLNKPHELITKSELVIRLKRGVEGDTEKWEESNEESDEEEDCPRRKFWHPKYKKCVPFCKSGKRDKTTGLCLGNVQAWTNDHDVFIPRHGQRMSPPKGSQMVYQGIGTKWRNVQPRGSRG